MCIQWLSTIYTIAHARPNQATQCLVNTEFDGQGLVSTLSGTLVQPSLHCCLDGLRNWITLSNSSPVVTS